MKASKQQKPASTELDETERGKVLRLLEYLTEFVRLRTKVVRSIEQYRRDGLVAWFSDMPQGAGCSSPLWTETSDGKDGVWLEVHKETISSPPKLPDFLEPWADPEALARLDGREPELRQQAYLTTKGEDGVATQALHELGGHDEASGAWQRYLAEWRSWAGKNTPRARIQELYSELFRAYQKQSRLGEAFESVVGIGLLSWTTPQGQGVRRHVVVAQATLEFDPRRGVMSVKCPPPPDGARLQIEDDYIEPSEQPAREHYELAQQHLSTAGDDIWSDNVRAAIESWGTAFDPGTRFSTDTNPPKPKTRTIAARTTSFGCRRRRAGRTSEHRRSSPLSAGLVDDATTGIQRDNLALAALPRDYACPALDKSRLGQLIDLIRSTGVSDPSAQRLQRDAALEASEVRR